MTLHKVTSTQMTSGFSVGDLITSSYRAMTRERMRWYVDAQETAVRGDGKPHFGGPTIHDDDAYALKQGLPGIIADGMISTNWILGLLTRTFGTDYVRSGRLRTKYIAPVYEDMKLRSCAQITALEQQDEGLLLRMDVWCETPDGQKVTVGEAETRFSE
ncbi:MaoC family dehydratase [Roseibium sp.]|uniref:MaoC family dehydratase n=1 Tax=Roseibium sp. TaxID=1936156 RepID=UPI003A981B80